MTTAAVVTVQSRKDAKIQLGNSLIHAQNLAIVRNTLFSFVEFKVSLSPSDEI